MPDLNHLWQRLLQALALLLGLGVGVAATVFGYSNTSTVTVGFSIWHLGGVPLWSVALVPLGVLLVLGTLYHWWSSVAHFTENIGHRRRVHELEEEVGRLKSHLDQVLEMPDHGATPTRAADEPEPEPEPVPEPVAVEHEPSNGSGKDVKSAPLTKTKPIAVAAAADDAPALESTEAANSKA